MLPSDRAEIEAATRALLLELNQPRYRAAAGDTVGQFPVPGSLLPPLVENAVDPDWERFLRTLLLNYGTNLRNTTNRPGPGRCPLRFVVTTSALPHDRRDHQRRRRLARSSYWGDRTSQ